MCGRFERTSDHLPALEAALGMDLPFARPEPRYNIAPGQMINIIRADGDSWLATTARWGLVPHWSKTEKLPYSTINARAETVASKPVYRHAFRSQRCLVPANGYYEWKKLENGKQPYHIGLHGGEPFAFAGLWERWRPETGDDLYTCTIVTTNANRYTRAIHERMPVIVPPRDYLRWLAATTPATELDGLMMPYPGRDLDAWPISARVNSVRNEAPALLDPIGAALSHQAANDAED